MQAVTISGKDLSHVPEEHRDEALYLAAIKSNYNAFQYVPEDLKAQQAFCEKSVKANPRTLSYVDADMKTYDMCKNAVSCNGGLFKNVPHEMRDYALSLEAVVRYRANYALLPDDLKMDEAICLATLDESGAYVHPSKMNDVVIPKERYDREFCLKALALPYFKLRKTPKEHWDAAFLEYAVECRPWNIRDIGNDQLTYELCLKAVSLNGNVLTYVPDKFKDTAMYETALQTSHQVFKILPPELKTYKRCLELVTKHKKALHSVPDRMKDEALCRAAIKSSCENFVFAPEHWLNIEFCMEALKKSLTEGNLRTVLDYIPENLYEEVTQDYADIIAKQLEQQWINSDTLTKLSEQLSSVCPNVIPSPSFK